MLDEIKFPWKMRLEESRRLFLYLTSLFFVFFPVILQVLCFFVEGYFRKMEFHDYALFELFCVPLSIVGLVQTLQYVECTEEGIKIFNPFNGWSQSVLWDEIKKITLQKAFASTPQGFLLPTKEFSLITRRKNLSIVLTVYSENNMLILLKLARSRACNAKVDVSQEQIEKYYRQTFWDYIKKIGGKND